MQFLHKFSIDTTIVTEIVFRVPALYYSILDIHTSDKPSSFSTPYLPLQKNKE